jgi:hypothetical protein
MVQTVDREQVVVLRWRRRIACEALAPALDRAFPIDRVDSFEEALKAIDDAETAAWRDRTLADESPGVISCDAPGAGR